MIGAGRNLVTVLAVLCFMEWDNGVVTYISKGTNLRVILPRCLLSIVLLCFCCLPRVLASNDALHTVKFRWAQTVFLLSSGDATFFPVTLPLCLFVLLPSGPLPGHGRLSTEMLFLTSCSDNQSEYLVVRIVLHFSASLQPPILGSYCLLAVLILRCSEARRIKLLASSLAS